MNPVLQDAVKGSGTNVHSPFFGFQEGESRESMAAKLDGLLAVGIDSFIGCVHSSQYMGSSFWKDMDVMIEELQKVADWLRKQGEMMAYLFFNESFYQEVHTTVVVPEGGTYVLYDAMENRFYKPGAQKAVGVQETVEGTEANQAVQSVEAEGSEVMGLAEAGTEIRLDLAPFETIVVLFGGTEGIEPEELPAYGEAIPVSGVWSLSLATGDAYPEFTPAGTLEQLENMGTAERFQELYGTLRYETKVTFSAGTKALDLGKAFDTVEVFVNGTSAGVRICLPYRFEIASLLKERENTLAVEVTGGNRTTQNQTLQYEPFGLLEPVQALFGKAESTK